MVLGSVHVGRTHDVFSYFSLLRFLGGPAEVLWAGSLSVDPSS